MTERKTIMANKGAILTTEQSLNAGDYLVAANAQYFAIMQSDGNFVIYQGSDPAHQGTPIWATNTVDIRQYMGFSAIMQSDGNFVLYYGTGYGNVGGARWASNTPQAQGQYFALLRNDGHLVLFHGTPSTPGDPYWASQTGVLTTQLTITSGNNQTQPRVMDPLGDVHAYFGLLTVTLTDNIGDPLSGKQVTWSVGSKPSAMGVDLALDEHGQYIGTTTSTTNANGIATLNQLGNAYEYGITALNQLGEVSVIAYGADGTFNIVASSGSASVTFTETVSGTCCGLTTTILAGNNQSVPRTESDLPGGTATFAPLQVKVLNPNGTPASGVQVGFLAIFSQSMAVQFNVEGDSQLGVYTDANGIATANVMWGNGMIAYYASGPFTVVASTGGGGQVTFNETVSS
jgi:hypothetical protein